jgi:hypothetical protein
VSKHEEESVLRGHGPRAWRILRKEVHRIDSDSVELRLHVERDGVARVAVVSGRMYDEKNVGDDVELSER